jgi:hypothetical protein
VQRWTATFKTPDMNVVKKNLKLEGILTIFYLKSRAIFFCRTVLKSSPTPWLSFVRFFLSFRQRQGGLIEREDVIIQFASSAETWICMQTRGAPECFI